jgi:sigma-E factor negative regulatory protein RseA
MMNSEHAKFSGAHADAMLASKQEQWSALHDGQLSNEQALILVRESLQDESMMQQWRSMSLIGQSLRAEMRYETLRSISASVQHSVPAVQVAANDGRWKMVAGFAALAAIGSLAWGLLGSGAGVSPSQVLAGNSVNAPIRQVALGATGAAGQEAVMIRNPRLDEFLAAHRQFGGVSALQQPAGSLRSVSSQTIRP